MTKNTQGSVCVENVIHDRLCTDKNRQMTFGGVSKNITKEFTHGESKKEIHRCRLRACLYQDATDSFKIAECISETIKDSKDKNFGRFQISCMSEPHGSCEKGGWNAFLVSQSRVGSSGFYPIFVFANSDADMQPEPVDKVYPNFKQISTEEMEVFHNSTFKFRIPSQQQRVVQSLKEYRYNTYITLYREADDEYATGMVRFDYHDIHTDLDEEECHYCELKKNMPLTEVRKDNKRKKCKRSRNDSAMTSTSGISDVGSPMSTTMQHEQNENSSSYPDFNDIIGQPQNPTMLLDLGLADLEPYLMHDGSKRDGQKKVESEPEETTSSSEQSETESDTETPEDSSDSDEMESLCKNTKQMNF